MDVMWVSGVCGRPTEWLRLRIEAHPKGVMTVGDRFPAIYGPAGPQRDCTTDEGSDGAIYYGASHVERLTDTGMPIVDIQVVTGTVEAKAIGKEISQLLADELGRLFDTEPGRTWVRLRWLEENQYAENGSVLGSGGWPTFVDILQSELPEPAVLRREMTAVAEVVARILGRPRETVHVLYGVDAKGRIGFGGTLLE